MIPKEVIDNEDQAGLDEIAAGYGLELDHRKTFSNQVKDVENHIDWCAREKERQRQEALRDPRNWTFAEGYKLSKFWGPNPNGGIYLVKANGMQFFVPKDEIQKYRID
jgi:hypothetical protein